MSNTRTTHAHFMGIPLGPMERDLKATANKMEDRGRPRVPCEIGME